MHYSKYCKKIIIFYLTLSPLFCLSSLTLSPLSLISHLCLYHWTQQPQPSTTEHSRRIRDPRICDPRPTIHNQSNANTSLSWSKWSFGFYWSWVVKFKIFCLWVLLIDAFLVDLWSFGCLGWWVIVGLFYHLAGNEGSNGSYKS